MNTDDARRLAWKVLGEIEEMMSGRGVGILARGRHDSCREEAFFFDREYNELAEAIVDILKVAAAQAQTPAPTSRCRGDENG